MTPRNLMLSFGEVGSDVAGVSDLIENNQQWIPNYGELWRAGETISTAFVESAVDQVLSKRFVKKQQMSWSRRGAHLLFQVRTRVLNEELRDNFE